MTLAGEAQSLPRDRSSGVNLLFAMLDWSHIGSPSSSACLLLKSSANSSNEWTPSTSSSISSNEASMHWSISTHMGIREPAHQVFVPTNLVACRSVFESTGPEGQFQQAGGLYRDISQA